MNKAISLSTSYEAYFDLWGYSTGWIETIQDTVLNFKEIDTKDRSEEAESYSNPACMAARFISTDKDRVEKLCAKINRLLNLAKKTYIENLGG